MQLLVCYHAVCFQKCLVLYFSIQVSGTVVLSSVLFLMEGQTYLRNWFKAIDLIENNNSVIALILRHLSLYYK